MDGWKDGWKGRYMMDKSTDHTGTQLHNRVSTVRYKSLSIEMDIKAIIMMIIIMLIIIIIIIKIIIIIIIIIII